MVMTANKIHIVESAVPGLRVAFTKDDGKMLSAEIVRKDEERRVMYVKTRYGSEYCVPYEDVEWVLDNGGNWPKYIYLRLKGEIDRDGNPINGKEEKEPIGR